jgi:hypothetical protein
MTDANRCPDPDALLVLLYDDEGEPEERAALETHVAACSACGEVLSSLDTTRGVLGAWHAPRLPLGFALVRTPERSRMRQALWSSGLAAAAVLVLAAASSLAQLRITYDASGFTIATGAAPAAATVPAADRPAPAGSASARVDDAPAGSWVESAGKSDAPWRADLELVATQLRSELAKYAQDARATHASSTVMRVALPTTPAPARSMTDEDLLRRVQDLLDQSEVRQQQNLALRVTELGRQFELARQADIVQVEQTLTRIEQQRNELLRRVASTQPRP